jgi:hypothetical protein
VNPDQLTAYVSTGTVALGWLPMIVVLGEPSVHLRSFDAGLKGNLSTAALDSSTPATLDAVGTMSAQAAQEIIIARFTEFE